MKEAFTKTCLRLYGKIDAGARAQKVLHARAKLLYRAGKMLLAYPQTQTAQMKKFNEIEVQFGNDLVNANALLERPEVLHTPPEMIDTTEEHLLCM